ncbi:MAG: T9SS type A sorting domain-containing protein [Bacteroidota bacterium]
MTNSQPVTVNGVLTLQNGIFDNSINSVTLGGGGSTVTVLGSLVTPLPVELTSFAASVKGSTVELRWSTATEVNNSGFDVEKNVNGAWKKLGFIEGAGTSNAVHQYSYSDKAVSGSTVAYRLKQIDRDGKFSYSNTIEAVTALSANDYVMSQNYPNPFNPSTTFSFAAKNAERTTVKVYNLVGQEVAVLFNDVAQPNQLYTLRFDAKNLPSGIYLYSLRSASRNEVKKMMLMK